MSERIFGTDGVRGVYGEGYITEQGAFTIAAGLAGYLDGTAEGNRPVVVVGYDPRNSSPALSAAAEAGLSEYGADVFRVGMATTPAIAYATRHVGADAAVVISASHNPKEHNGIKIIGRGGRKLSDRAESQLNRRIVRVEQGHSSPKKPQRSGHVFNYLSMPRDYKEYILSKADEAGICLEGLSVVYDTAHGAASGFGQSIYRELGARVESIYDTPDGDRINEQCGATDMRGLHRVMEAQGIVIGIANDGDADRGLPAVLVNEDGRISAKTFDGDYMMYTIAAQEKMQGIVATVMTNSGIVNALRDTYGPQTKRSNVGDRYVAEALDQTGYPMGGEQSGHIIVPEFLPMGCGIYGTLRTLGAVAASGRSMESWYHEISANKYPQTLTNVPVKNKQSVQEDPDMQAAFEAANEQLANLGGRLLVRPSGTEQLFRVLGEGTDKQAVQAIVEQLVGTITARFAA